MTSSAPTPSPYSQKHSTKVEEVLSDALDLTFTSEPEDPLGFMGKFVLGRARASPTSTAYTNLHCRTVEKVLSEAVDSTFKDEPVSRSGKAESPVRSSAT